MFHKKKIPFYAVGKEIPLQLSTQYKLLDPTTLKMVKQAKNRATFLSFLVLLGFCAILGKLFYLNVMRQQPVPNRPIILQEDIPLIRKNILDRNGNILATSLPTIDLSVNPSKVKNPEEVAKALAKILPDTDEKELYKKLTSTANFKYLKRNITPTEQNSINWLGYYFLNEEKGEKRIYPHMNLFSHLLGVVDIDNNGVSGLEKSFNHQLTENSVQLSVDLPIQDSTYHELTAGIEKYKADGGTAVVLNVHTAEVLAMVSLPDYNPNFSIPNDPERLFNKAALGIYEFGSVFKLFNTAMALEAGVISPYSVFDVSEKLKIGRKRIEDFQGQNRPLLTPEVLMHSSNIGSVMIALKAGEERQRKFLKRFGFFEQLPLEIPEKASTLYPKAQKWHDLTVANVAYGYALSVSPLHLISAVAALVNGGTYRVPTFLKNGNQERPEYKVLTEKTSETIRNMMWAVVNWDTKPTKPIYGYAVGGKTGSANLIKDGKYVQRALRTTFVGAFPMNNPKIAVLVTLENPKGIKETWNFNTAGWNAKPVALNIISTIAPYLGILPIKEYPIPAYIKKAIENSKAHKKGG